LRSLFSYYRTELLLDCYLFMNRPKYDINQYQAVLRMQSRGKIRLLVEGEEDRKVFKRLISVAADHKDCPGEFRDSIVVDISDYLIKTERLKQSQTSENIGAREKVEIVCQSIDGKEYASKLIGFVDREFRGFEIDEVVIDSIASHRVENRLIWSRGHSIENYFFEKAAMKSWVLGLLEQEWFDDVIASIDIFFDPALLYACAVSLAVRDISQRERLEKLTEKVDRSIDYELLVIDSSVLHFDYDEWVKRLQSRQNLPSNVAEAIISQTKKWVNRLSDADSETHRWLCRGHTGMKVLGAWLDSCTFYANPSYRLNSKEGPKKYLGQSNVSDPKRFISFTSIWIQRALKNECAHPIEELRKLGLDL